MLLWMRIRLPALLGIAALLVLAAVVARGRSAVPVGMSRPLFDWLRFPDIDITGGVASSGRGSTTGEGGWAAWIGWAIMLLPVLMLGVAIVAALIVALRRRIGVPTPVRRGDDETGPPATDIREHWLPAVEKAREALDQHSGGPPSDAVIAAWLRLEGVAADTGTARRAHQTPTEFTTGLTIEHQSLDQPLDTLRRLYQRARFGPDGTVQQRHADQARQALDEIVEAFTREPAKP
jgi:hypothetical protein